MKKKLIATLVAGAVLSTGVIGLTACGGLSVPGGEELANKEAWTKAFTDTLALTNYTMENSSSQNINVKGTVNNGTKDLEQDFTIKTSATALIVYGEDNDKAYMESTSKSEGKGTYLGKEENANATYNTKAYYELKENKNDVKTYWGAEYAKVESKSSEGVYNEENYWAASVENHFMSNSISSLLYIAQFYETKDAAAPKSIAELYEKFTYNGGVYTADLYTRVSLDNSGDLPYVNESCKVTVSFKGGYVIGLVIKVDAEDSIEEANQYNLSYKCQTETIYTLKDIKSSDASKKVNKDITKAIDEAKAEEENA